MLKTEALVNEQQRQLATCLECRPPHLAQFAPVQQFSDSGKSRETRKPGSVSSVSSLTTCQPKHRLGNPEICIFLLYRQSFTGSEYAISISFNFENKITKSDLSTQGSGDIGYSTLNLNRFAMYTEH